MGVSDAECLRLTAALSTAQQSSTTHYVTLRQQHSGQHELQGVERTRAFVHALEAGLV